MKDKIELNKKLKLKRLFNLKITREQKNLRTQRKWFYGKNLKRRR